MKGSIKKRSLGRFAIMLDVKDASGKRAANAQLQRHEAPSANRALPPGY
jgi:hypothetical protein